MDRKQITILYRNGKERCPSCNGQITYGSSITDRLPIGLGFVNGRFQIDAVRRSGFGGECMECFQPVFAVKSRRHVTTFPNLRKGIR